MARAAQSTGIHDTTCLFVRILTQVEVRTTHSFDFRKASQIRAGLHEAGKVLGRAPRSVARRTSDLSKANCYGAQWRARTPGRFVCAVQNRLAYPFGFAVTRANGSRGTDWGFWDRLCVQVCNRRESKLGSLRSVEAFATYSVGLLQSLRSIPGEGRGSEKTARDRRAGVNPRRIPRRSSAKS